MAQEEWEEMKQLGLQEKGQTALREAEQNLGWLPH